MSEMGSKADLKPRALDVGFSTSDSGHSLDRVRGWDQMSGQGQTEKNSVRAYVFRFTPELGHCSSQSLKRAISGLIGNQGAARSASRFRCCDRRHRRPCFRRRSLSGTQGIEATDEGRRSAVDERVRRLRARVRFTAAPWSVLARTLKLT